MKNSTAVAMLVATLILIALNIAILVTFVLAIVDGSWGRFVIVFIIAMVSQGAFAIAKNVIRNNRF